MFPPIQLVQVLNIDHKGKNHSSQVVLTSKDNTLSIVSLMPFGGEAFRVTYSGFEIKSQAMPFMPKDFDLKFALADIVLIYTENAEKLQSWLSVGSQVVDSGLQREILYQSKPLIRIQYSQVEKFDAKISFVHLVRGYKIQIDPISRDTP